MNAAHIRSIKAREILDSRGFPTIEVDLEMASDSNHTMGRARVPSGASTGEGEALELRDGDPKRFLGKGVLKAIGHINRKITPALLSEKAGIFNQASLDETLCKLDGTPGKSNLGANAILGVSMAFARAQAKLANLPTYRWIAQEYGTEGVILPVPLMNILNGGKHADNGLEVQEFMIVPAGFDRFSVALRAGAEVFHHLKKILHSKKLATAVGDEGGFAPVFSGERAHEQALQTIVQAIETAGYQPGKNIFLALDAAASEFKDSKKGYRFEGKFLSAQEMIALYRSWFSKYPIVSIEDGLAEHDWSGWAELTRELGGKCQLVGDDLFVTNPAYLKKGIETHTANAILIKLNQIGTVSETLETMKLASRSGYGIVTSHRSGETEDTFIADLAVGTDCGQIKTGSASRTDRIAKYNQLLRIEEQLDGKARFAGKSVFPGLRS